jgi:competence protein ComEA
MRQEDQHWKDWFVFSKRERNGNLLLTALVLVFTAIAVLLQRPLYTPEFHHYISNTPDSMTTINSFQNTESEVLPAFFRFDPNHASREEWKRLGLKPKQIATILKYREKGGEFRFKEDLLKVYTLDPTWVMAAYPFIDLPEKNTIVRDTLQRLGLQNQLPHKSGTPAMVELNTADSADLLMLPGVGHFFARNILRYRNALGGFHDFDQLSEIWKMTEAKVQSLLPHIDIDETKVKQLEINKVGKEELSVHPYISHRQAELIVNYREKHGAYRDTAGVIRAALFTDLEWKKLVPYISLAP